MPLVSTKTSAVAPSFASPGARIGMPPVVQAAATTAVSRRAAGGRRRRGGSRGGGGRPRDGPSHDRPSRDRSAGLLVGVRSELDRLHRVSSSRVSSSPGAVGRPSGATPRECRGVAPAGWVHGVRARCARSYPARGAQTGTGAGRRVAADSGRRATARGHLLDLLRAACSWRGSEEGSSWCDV